MEYPDPAPAAARRGAVRVYWQPGCSSCLKAKEFLARRGVAFRSVNVLEETDGLRELQQLGARGVPVVAQGDRFVYAQSTDDIVDFLGLSADGAAGRLPMSELLRRLPDILETGIRQARALPDARLGDRIARRDRSMAQLIHHIVRIPEVLMLNQRSGRLDLEMVVVDPPAGWRRTEQFVAYGDAVLSALRPWCASDVARDGQARVQTFYGVKSMHELLERTAWHDAQHIRQLSLMLESFGVEPVPGLPPGLLEGLPLPADVWDE